MTPTEYDSLGQRGRVIVDVVEQSDGAFLVMSCVPANDLGDVSSGPDPRDAAPFLIGTLLDVQDGVLKMTDPWFSSAKEPDPGLGGECDGTMAGLRYGYFDPDPLESGVWTLDDLVSPDGLVGAPPSS